MTELICKLFIKNNLSLSDSRKKYGTLASAVGITVNLILSALKLFVGIITASVAITADALNNFSDAGSSLVSLVSFKLSTKPADRDHPFGHARIEYIASMIVSFIILLVGLEMMLDSANSIIFPEEASKPDFSIASLIILGVSIMAKLWLAVFFRKIGKKINSSVVLAASTDSLFDCVSTTAVLISSLIIKFTGIEIIDSILGLVVSFLILFAGIKILNETKNSLLGEAPVEKTINQIKEIVNEEPEVLGMHDLLVHNYGPNTFIASFHAEVDGNKDIYMLHDKIDNLERKIGKELNILCTIHLDPITTNDKTLNEYHALAKECIKRIYPEIGIHDFRMVVGESHTNLIFDIEVPFEIKENVSLIKQKIEKEIQGVRPECFCVITVDRC